MPLSAEPLVPSTTSEQMLLVTDRWMPVIVPWTTPDVSLVALRAHVTAPDATDSVWPSTLQLLKLRAVTVPRPLPDSPEPDLSEPVLVEVLQLTVRFDVVSLKVVTPAFPVIEPPGLALQVLAVTAEDAVALMPITSAADMTVKSAPAGLRILTSSLIDVVARIELASTLLRSYMPHK